MRTAGHRAVPAPQPPSKSCIIRSLSLTSTDPAKPEHDRKHKSVCGAAEGYSIPAQRDACCFKADQLSAVVQHEYVNAGESARSADCTRRTGRGRRRRPVPPLHLPPAHAEVAQTGTTAVEETLEHALVAASH